MFMMADGLIDTRNARVSPLLLLPAELRNQIYNYVLASDGIKIVTPRATKRSGYSIVEKATNVIIAYTSANKTLPRSVPRNVNAVDLCRTSRTEPSYQRLRNDVEASLVLICPYGPEDRMAELYVQEKKRDVFHKDLELLIGEREGERTS
ncbi:hypothetical protein HBI88_172630 [Parastagonospora nodorum]|nr:hypothetical protein HBI46_211290 [Parastagonospora nodorum]KAH5761145.1 hypothetical protein HBI97_192570 [Parastagonospora nodorum]KAH5819422.1 hypothetical protein HBI96_052750 [Parastagonospora nodorum]KAH5820713.1 hypothetical protein HBI93_179880 [Parastagonospora nodorum]KAH5836473.1 hypothetical protein HBI94_009960 [Parastagonospora nodorum]